MRLEIAVVDLAGVVIARDEAADRVELCTDLDVGGLTPPVDLLALSLERAGTSLAVHPLIRSRAGSSVYTADEVETMLLQAVQAVQAAKEGAAGLIFGAMTAQGTIDRSTVLRFVDAARDSNADIELTFHRAFDQSRRPLQALDDLASLGFNRVMSSGGKTHSGICHSGLSDVVAGASGRLEVMAGGGLKLGDISPLIGVGVDAVHFSARRAGESATDRSLVRAARCATRGGRC
jgi:copper homeostasis protein